MPSTAACCPASQSSHEETPAELENVPGAHFVHALLLAYVATGQIVHFVRCSDTLPASHCSQMVLPSVLILPASQSKQSITSRLRRASAYLPAAHLVHSDVPVCQAYVAGGHSLQELLPSTFEKVPNLHLTHAFWWEYSPTGQIWHTPLASWPKPGQQSVLQVVISCRVEGHGTPPMEASATTCRERVVEPWPQVFVHSVHGVNSESVQSTAHGSSLQARSVC